MNAPTKNNLAIYVHIPFCASKCAYCNFTSFANCSEKSKNDYFNALEKEICSNKQNSFKRNVSSIFIGGGTPSVVDAKHIINILNNIKQNYNVMPDAEITIEANPSSITLEKLKQYKNCGINRISFGVQSIFDNDLKKLNRNQTKKQVKQAIKLSKKIGIKNINLDFLLGLENQSIFKIIKTAFFCACHKISHISAYMLMVEDKTILKNMIKQKKYIQPSEEKTVNFYNTISKLLKFFGFKRYETSNFAKKSFQSKHNLTYWRGGEYIGFGLAAHSYVSGIRFENTSEMSEYIIGNHTFSKEVLSEQTKKEEFVMLGLRLENGINLNDYYNQFNTSLLKEKNREINFLLGKKIIKIKNNNLFIKPKFMGVLNQVILMLI